MNGVYTMLYVFGVHDMFHVLRRLCVLGDYHMDVCVYIYIYIYIRKYFEWYSVQNWKKKLKRINFINLLVMRGRK